MNHLTHSLAILMATALSALTGFGQSCIDPDACNYDPNAGTPNAVCLEIIPFATHDSGDLAGMTTWRVYFRPPTLRTLSRRFTAINPSPSR